MADFTLGETKLQNYTIIGIFNLKFLQMKWTKKAIGVVIIITIIIGIIWIHNNEYSTDKIMIVLSTLAGIIGLLFTLPLSSEKKGSNNYKKNRVEMINADFNRVDVDMNNDNSLKTEENVVRITGNSNEIHMDVNNNSNEG